MQKNNQLLASTVKTARFIYFGIALQATLFAMWGQNFFISLETPATGGITVYILFGMMGLVSFAYGFRFFPSYTRLKKNEILKYPDKKRKETLLLISAIHFLMLEFVAVVGILLAIFVQQRLVILPFFLMFMVGLVMSYPKVEWYEPFLKESNESASV